MRKLLALLLAVSLIGCVNTSPNNKVIKGTSIGNVTTTDRIQIGGGLFPGAIEHDVVIQKNIYAK